MLSYKHGYHAGNHADVLKHTVLIYLYNLTKNHNNSISYIDTHSGNGVYKYTSKYMDKNKEYKFGIKKIEKYVGKNKLIINYLNILKKINENNNFYPGSPYLISSISSEKNKLFLCELHKNEYINLKKNLRKSINAKVLNLDGFEYLMNLSRKKTNNFILIDPSYEIKEDFDKIINILKNVEKFENSKILIWYPILSYDTNDLFIEQIRKVGINNLINLELPIYNDIEMKGMKGSGLLIINFNKKIIFNHLKNLIKDLYNLLKNNEEVYKPKIRYL